MGNNFYSTKEWRALCKTIMKENVVCEICGYGLELHIHHKKSIIDGGEKLSRDNLMVLCNKHHAKFHTLQRFYKNNHAPRSCERIIREIENKYKKVKNESKS